MTTMREQAKKAANQILSHLLCQPEIGLIFGSGLSHASDEAKCLYRVPFFEIPFLPRSNVSGHPGEVKVLDWNGVKCAAFCGRFHLYEGLTSKDVVKPVFLLHEMGIKTLVLTNAAGGINTKFRAGDLMNITDHLNLTGENPLIGPNDESLGPRFPDLSQVYWQTGLEILKKAAQKTGVTLKEGVYAGCKGPAYETPAEIRMLRIMGADAAGMSTVLESISASHMGLKVLGISLISNLGSGIINQILSHEEVLEAGKQGSKILGKLLSAALPEIQMELGK